MNSKTPCAGIKTNVTLIIRSGPIRIDRALLQWLCSNLSPELSQFPEISRNRLKRAFQDGQIQLRGTPVRPSFSLTEGSHAIEILNLSSISFSFSSPLVPAPPIDGPVWGDLPIPVIYEDDSIFVLNKPSGIPSAPLSADDTGTAVSFAVAHAPQMVGVARHPQKIGQNLEPGLLHRLDTGTSGLLVFAKTQREFDRLLKAWKERRVGKFYRALISHRSDSPSLSPSPSQLGPRLPLHLNRPLGHDARSSKRMIAIEPLKLNLKNIRGKPLPASTHLLAVHSTASPETFDFEIEIKTGVLHQIRCHLAAEGWPVLGDTIYKGAPSSRLWLHAWKLTIPQSTGKVIQIQAPLPSGWANLGD